jgi:hypothetical protein
MLGVSLESVLVDSDLLRPRIPSHSSLEIELLVLNSVERRNGAAQVLAHRFEIRKPLAGSKRLRTLMIFSSVYLMRFMEFPVVRGYCHAET